MAISINKIIYTKITILSFILLLFPLVANSYNPDYNLAINCGSSTNDAALDKRLWVGDNIDNKNLFTFIEPKTKNPSLKSSPNSLSNIEIPFTTARISLSNFTYSFSNITTTSPVFLRLHFYPTSYQNFEPSNAIFSVKVNDLTFLKNFNPSLWFYHDEKLNITFIPNSINQSNVYYTFINGIEVVSMPSFLYYTNLSDPNYYFKPVDSEALEMVHRVNVGDIQVPANQDTGMFRNWENDFPLYLARQYPQSVSSVYGSDHLNYLNNTIPIYTAPESVYLTARSYGMDVTEDYNVTWNFEVDSSFTYMVRLHFCEFDMTIKNQGDRVFQIFIDNTLVEEKADVIRWGGARMVPVHKDYVVSMEGLISQIERIYLSIKLQRAPKTIFTLYRDVILNGIEIFKISDKYNNLAGLNPNKHIILPSQKQKSKSKKSTIVIVGVSSLLLTFLAVGIIVLVRRTRRFESPIKMIESLWKTKKEGSSPLPSYLCRYFTIAEIRAATKNFNDENIIGVGGFGNVYKGFIDRYTPVAIKRLRSGSQQGANEFMNEIELLSQLRHIHLVSLVGYCNDKTEMILVYEFMKHGTLCEYLYGSNNQPLPWKQRLEILLGAARGLNYLHTEVKNKIIHRDVKSTNILLDEKWIAKVSDFELSKVGPTGISTTHVSTIVKGSLGYLDPTIACYYIGDL